MVAKWVRRRWWGPRAGLPPSEQRGWVHPSELPSFEKLPTSLTHIRGVRRTLAAVAVLVVVGATVLNFNRGHALTPITPAHYVTALSDLPSVGRGAAGHLVDLTISTPGHSVDVPALVLANNLAVTTTKIPADALLTGSTPTRVNFPVSLVGWDRVMQFSIVRLSTHVSPAKLAALPANAEVTAIAPVERGSTTPPSFTWSATVLGDPTLSSHGVVHYLATRSRTSLGNHVDAIAVDAQGRVVAVLSSQHEWFAATFVERVAQVVATGRGCHATLGLTGTTAQGGGVTISHIVPFSPAAHANLRIGDVVTQINGATVNTWQDLASALYLTPAYSVARLTYLHGSHVRHAIVTLSCAL